MDSVMPTMDRAFADFAARERSWLPHDRRGRWVVIEPGIGRLLKGSSAGVRKIADALSERRIRRFSSLSKARAFARRVHGHVARWHRAAPRGFVRQRATPWEWALRKTTNRIAGVQTVMRVMERGA